MASSRSFPHGNGRLVCNGPHGTMLMAGTLGTSLSADLAGKLRCRELSADMGRRDSASAWSAAAPRCVASLFACCAGKRFAFPQLRTLAGSNPSAWRRRSNSLNARGSRLIWDGGIPRPPGRRPRPAASLRSLRAALENASRFLSSAPLRVRIPPLAHEKALQVHKSLERYVLWGWDGGIRTPNSRHQKPEFYR